MSLPVDPVGSSKIKYKEKLERDKNKANNIFLPYQTDEGKISLLQIPFFEIEVLEYGPRSDSPVLKSGSLPNKGMGAPSIGTGGTGISQPSDSGEIPLPGSGLPGSPLYPVEDEGEGEGKLAGVIPMDPITGKPIEETVNIDEIAKELELELIKPGKIETEYDIEFPSVGKSGPENLLDWDTTVMSSIERQMLFKIILDKRITELNEKRKELEVKYKNKEINDVDYSIEIDKIEKAEKNLKALLKYPLENPFRIKSIEKEDERYILPEFIPLEHKSCVIMFIRDISGSITLDQLKASSKLSSWIEEWVKKFYENTKLIYILHNYDAWEVEREDYYGVVESGGGTRFSSAYEIVLKIFMGEKYSSKAKEIKKINPDIIDVYIVQITDGFGQSNEEEVKPLKEIMPKITRFCYVQEEQGGYISEYKEYLEKLFGKEKLRTTSLKGYEDEDIKNAMRDLFGKRK
ncbi:MAG: DUF444 family protein [Candidatus Aenigmatarchaeota archaeon]